MAEPLFLHRVFNTLPAPSSLRRFFRVKWQRPGFVGDFLQPLDVRLEGLTQLLNLLGLGRNFALNVPDLGLQATNLLKSRLRDLPPGPFHIRSPALFIVQLTGDDGYVASFELDQPLQLPDFSIHGFDGLIRMAVSLEQQLVLLSLFSQGFLALLIVLIAASVIASGAALLFIAGN